MTTKDAFESLHSLLFVPALNDRFIERAHERGADAVVFDLEDSIVDERKTAARGALGSALSRVRPHGLPLLVRVNNEPELLEPDLQAAVAAGADAILLPKIDTPDMLRDADRMITAFEGEARREAGVVKYVALIESPTGLFNMADILRTGGRLRGLGFGSEDFAAVLGVEPDADALSAPAQQVALAARAFGLAAWGLPGSIANFDDVQAFAALLRRAKAYGFTGALGIHPKQIEVINKAFRPGAEDLARARRIVDAYEQAVAGGAGAVALDGKMIDAPVVARARRLLGV